MRDKLKNANRFTGFADIYEDARPRIPRYPVDVICRYLGRPPETVVDLGCGTGLSTEVWQGVCPTVLGIEPSEDMLRMAKEKETPSMRFQQGFGEDTGLLSACADVVTCSQSFHWMEPNATLAEVNRILKKGGVFAAMDCDWPPVTKWEAEQAYMNLFHKVRTIEHTVPKVKSTFVRYPKSRHLANMEESGYFSYVRELVFSSTESCTKERFRNMVLSLGNVQTILKTCPELIEDDLLAFHTAVNDIFNDDTFEIEFCYRMRLGIK